MKDTLKMTGGILLVPIIPSEIARHMVTALASLSQLALAIGGRLIHPLRNLADYPAKKLPLINIILVQAMSFQMCYDIKNYARLENAVLAIAAMCINLSFIVWFLFNIWQDYLNQPQLAAASEN